MLPFFLYFAAGVITGFHVYTLMSLVVYGTPINPLEIVSLLGSLGLVIAAYISLFKPYAAARLALLASMVIWCFYGPAISQSIRTKFGKPRSVSSAGALFKRPENLGALLTMTLTVERAPGFIPTRSPAHATRLYSDLYSDLK